MLCAPNYKIRAELSGAFSSSQSSPRPLSPPDTVAWGPGFWQNPKSIPFFSHNSTPTTMDEKLRKSGGANTSSNEIPSPSLIRRRLSAPETIMRKHMLAQQRSESQDSDLTPSPDSKTRQWRNNNDLEAGSDSNLSTKRDSDLMRKSTLLKRFWNNSKPFGSSRFSGTFYEWQHSFGKLSSGRSTHSLTSIHSSPEHIMRSQSRRSLNGSPQHKASSLSGRKLSPLHQSNHQTPNSNRRKISTYESNFESYTTSYCSDETAVNSNNNRTVTTSTTTPKTITDFDTNTRTTTSCTTFSDNNSDSAYTNSRSNFSRTSNNNSTRSSEINKEILEGPEVPNKDINQFSLELSNNDNSQKNQSSQYIKYSNNNNVSETSTQTHESTNVNVISNVHLSQSTLDLIFNQVMQDVQKSVPEKSKTKIKSETISPAAPSDRNRDLTAVVQPVQSFYLQPPQSEVSKNHNNQIVKYMISNVGTGSPYCKPAEVPQVVVPRYSALPRTTSMEVNISSGDSTDKESDTISLVDSLEDSSAFQTDSAKNKDDPNIASDSSVLLPDNSSLKPTPVISKPTAFFIPIQVEDQTGFSAVSDHLPDKVRDRLLKRQQKREDRLHGKSKLSSSRSDSNYVSASDNGNQVQGDINLNSQLGYNINKAKKRSKLLLPSIKTFRRIKIDDDKGKKINKPEKRKTLSGEKFVESGQSEQNHWIPSTRKDKLSPVYTTKSEYVYDNDGPKKFYHKTEFNNSNKRIEILEIMECLEPSEKLSKQLSKGKSRIPILVHSKLPKMDSPKGQANKPTFLDLSSSQTSDPKLDQLIANILIETLNNPNLERTPSPRSNRMFSVVTDNNRPTDQAVKHLSSPSRYQQKFEAIPEELSFQSSNEELQNERCPNNNEVKNNNEDTASPYQGRAAIAVVKDENFSSIPKGWITFYMLHKNRGSPDSTSDEGKDLDNACKTSSYCAKKEAVLKERETCFGDVDEDEKKLQGMGINVKQGKCHLSDTNDNFSSSSSNLVKTAWHPSNGRSKKFNSQRKQRFKVNGDCEKPKKLGNWSVTVSGTNTYGQFAPDFQMCLKFPDHKKTHVFPSQSDSGLGVDNERRVQFPKINTKLDRSSRTENNNENPSIFQRLPDIGRNQLSKSQRKCDSSISSKNATVPSSVEPRQTRTSLRRYNLTRPKIDPHQALPPDSSRSNFNIFDNRNYADILKHLPEILSITGNAISSDNNSKSPY